MHRAEARRILGVADSATQEELRAAYRREALRTHPDKNPTRVQEATEQFRRVYEAYDLLRQDRPVPEERQGNAERPERPSRQGADEQRERGGAGPSFAEAKTFFQEVFGNAVVPVMTVTGATLEAWPAVRTAARVVASVGPPVALGLGGLAVGAIGVAAAAQIFSRESAIDFHSRCDREGDELRAAHTRAQQVLAELKGAKERARQRVTALEAELEVREYRRRDDVAFQTRVSAAIAAAAAAVACCFTNGLGWLAVWSCGIMAAMLLCVHLHAYYMRQCDAEELASAREAHRSVCDEVAQRSQEAAALEERLCSISRRGFLINVATGQFLDSTGKRNSVVKLWGDGRNPGGSPDNLKWRLTAEQYVVNVATGQFLDSTGRRDAVVKLWGNGRDPGSSPKNLKWRLTAEGYLVNVATGQFLDSTGKRGAAVRLCGHGSHPGPCPDNLKWMFLACPNNL